MVGIAGVMGIAAGAYVVVGAVIWIVAGFAALISDTCIKRQRQDGVVPDPWFVRDVRSFGCICCCCFLGPLIFWPFTIAIFFVLWWNRCVETGCCGEESESYWSCPTAFSSSDCPSCPDPRNFFSFCLPSYSRAPTRNVPTRVLPPVPKLAILPSIEARNDDLSIDPSNALGNGSSAQTPPVALPPPPIVVPKSSNFDLLQSIADAEGKEVSALMAEQEAALAQCQKLQKPKGPHASSASDSPPPIPQRPTMGSTTRISTPPDQTKLVGKILNEPEHVCCPISCSPFVDPVVVNGHAYERRAIVEWFADGHTTDPLTNEEMCESDREPNRLQTVIAIKQAVEKWRLKVARRALEVRKGHPKRRACLEMARDVLLPLGSSKAPLSMDLFKRVTAAMDEMESKPENQMEFSI